MNALIRSDLKQRTRGKRWWVLLVLWTAILFALLAFVRSAAIRAQQFVSVEGEITRTDDPIGPAMFGSLMLFTLILACLVVPSLTSTAINGERERGTFAVLQATMLRPWEIFLAKLLSGLLTTVAFLLATVPLTLWAASEGGVSLIRVMVTYLILTLVCAVLLAFGLMASTFIRRPALSAVASYGIVFALTIGTLIVFGLSMITATAGVAGPGENPVGLRWLILAPNPFVVVADAAPRSGSDTADPLAGIRGGVRTLRSAFVFTPPADRDELPAVWPAGMAIEVALALGAAYLTINRLRIPARRLAPGQRVA